MKKQKFVILIILCGIFFLPKNVFAMVLKYNACGHSGGLVLQEYSYNICRTTMDSSYGLWWNNSDNILTLKN